MENQASQLRNMHFRELDSEKVPMNLLKAQTNTFLHDYFLFYHQEWGCFVSFDKIWYNLLYPVMQDIASAYVLVWF